jgi:hypothetical protein
LEKEYKSFNHKERIIIKVKADKVSKKKKKTGRQTHCPGRDDAQ